MGVELAVLHLSITNGYFYHLIYIQLALNATQIMISSLASLAAQLIP